MPLHTLTLTVNGPDPDEITIHGKERDVEIVNQLGVAVEFTLDPPGFLNPSQGATLEVPATGKTVTAGASGCYSYEDPTSRERATRNGRINVE